MASSYKEESVKYKNEKQKLAADVPMPYRKKKVKKNKKANHKHEYVPGIYYSSYINFQGKVVPTINYGFHCKHCGRIDNLYYLWGSTRLDEFKNKYPDYVEVQMPQNWDYWKNKNVPLTEID